MDTMDAFSNLPPLGSVRGLPFRDMMVHVRFLIGASEGRGAYYAAEGEPCGDDWVLWGLVRDFDGDVRLEEFSLRRLCGMALSRGAALTRDETFEKRPMARAMEEEGARAWDGGL